MKNILARLKQETWAVEPSYANELLTNLESFSVKRENGEKHTAIANESVTLQKIGNVAVIAIDGVMYKKNIGGFCQSVASYEQIVSKIDNAEADSSIDTILFRVDTPGGSVAGADEVRNRIKNSSKKTVVFGENLLASAGMWIFSAAKELHTNEVTQIGSIGVIVVYETSKDDKKINAIVSSNAPNKHCDIADKKCKNRVQTKLNQYESMFLSRLKESFKKEEEEIITDFNEGDTILASDAKEKGYLKSITEFKPLLGKLVKDEKQATHFRITNQQTGEYMTREELQAQDPELYSEILNTGATAERNRIKAIFDTVPTALNNSKISDLAFDGKSTETEIKAALFDLNAKKTEKIKKQIETDGEDLAEQLHDVGNDTSTGQPDTNEKALVQARQASLEKINKRRGA